MIKQLLEKRKELLNLREQVEKVQARLKALESKQPAEISDQLFSLLIGEMKVQMQDNLLLDLFAKRKKAEEKNLWSPALGRELVKRALEKRLDYRLPQELHGDEDRHREIRLKTAQTDMEKTGRQLADANDSYFISKQSLRDRIWEVKEERQWKEGLYRLPPVLAEIPWTRNIAAQCGKREAPANLLFAIAYGLATAEHWWLWSPCDRENDWSLPALTSFNEVQEAYEKAAEDNQFPPLVRIGDASLEWAPISGGELDSNYDRKITIRIEPNAAVGVIQWRIGKWKERGDKWECSSFIASILSILPDAEDDRIIQAYFEALDHDAARYVAAVFQAKNAGVKSDIVDPETGNQIASSIEISREKEYFLHPGDQPRRSWTAEGEERPFAHLFSLDDFQKLVAEAEPLPWKAR